MLKITKQYIYDENRKLLAVQIPIEEYKKLEGFIENYIFANMLDDEKGKDVLSLEDAINFYNSIKK